MDFASKIHGIPRLARRRGQLRESRLPGERRRGG